jgi:hypothetical protein
MMSEQAMPVPCQCRVAPLALVGAAVPGEGQLVDFAVMPKSRAADQVAALSGGLWTRRLYGKWALSTGARKGSLRAKPAC